MENNDSGKIYETRCKICGKNIAMLNTQAYTYKRKYKSGTEFYCGWTHMQQADKQHDERRKNSRSQKLKTERAEFYRRRCADITEMHDNGCSWDEIADKWNLCAAHIRKIYSDRYNILHHEEAEAK